MPENEKIHDLDKRMAVIENAVTSIKDNHLAHIEKDMDQMNQTILRIFDKIDNGFTDVRKQAWAAVVTVTATLGVAAGTLAFWIITNGN